MAAMRAGRPADSEEARAAGEAHRAQISRWFYGCGYDIWVIALGTFGALARPKVTIWSDSATAILLGVGQ